MNKYLKSFLHRGLCFAGFGPIVLGIIYYIISRSVDSFSLGGGEILLSIISIYILAFLQAGASVFNQIEEWPLPKSLLCHFSLLYAAYVLCYVVNSWIPFDIKVIFIFTAIFVAVYFAVWITVYLIVKQTSQRLNEKIG